MLPEGNFSLTRELVLVVQGVEIRGAGAGKTVLDFSAQQQGAQGFLVRANNVVLKDFSLKNPIADGLVVRGAKRVEIDGIDVYWQGEALKKAGGYGIYPVLSKQVSIQNCRVSGATEAGIYLGQSDVADIKNNRVYDNTAGIDIENSSRVLVQGNEALDNSIGIVISNRPNLLKKASFSIGVKQNVFARNNRSNNAPAHSLIAELGQGMGAVVVASDGVTLQDNHFRENNAAHVSVLSFSSTGRSGKKDPLFDPYAEQVNIFANHYVRGEDAVAAVSSSSWRHALGVDIQWDGVKKNIRDRELNAICIRQEDSLNYVNLASDQVGVSESLFLEETCNS